MPTEDVNFGLLKAWIKDFKKQQGRNPFFEDFPDDIGLEWKRWKAHTQKRSEATARVAVRSNAQQENEVHIEKHGSTAGIYGAQIPTIAQLHHHAHATGARSRTNSQPNPFSRAARASSFSRRSTEPLHDRQAGLASSSSRLLPQEAPIGTACMGASCSPPLSPGKADPVSPLKEIHINQQQAVRGFGQIAAQKKQLGLLPAVQPPTACVPHLAKSDAKQQQQKQQQKQQQQQQQEQQPPKLSSTAFCTSMSCQADQMPGTASKQQLAEPDKQAAEAALHPFAAKATCSNSATYVKSTPRPGQAHEMPQVVPQVVPQDAPQVVLQSATTDALQPKASGVDAELLFSPQQMAVTEEASSCTAGCDQQGSAALQADSVLHDSKAGQPAVGLRGCDQTQAPQIHTQAPPSGPSEGSQAKLPQEQSQLAPKGLTSLGAAAAVKLTTASRAKQAVQGQGCGPAPRQKRQSATAKRADEQAAKRAKPTGTQAAPGTGPRTAPRGQSGKAAKLPACGKNNTAGGAYTGGKARPAGKAGPRLLSSPSEQPSAPHELALSQTVTKRSLRTRNSTPVIVDATPAEEDGGSSDCTDKASAAACDPADDSFHASGSYAACHARSWQQLAADSLPESSGTSNVEEQTDGQKLSRTIGERHQEAQSLVSSSDTDADSDVENFVDSPEQPATKAGKRKRASSTVGAQKPAGPQRAKHDSAGPEAGQQSGAVSASRGCQGGGASANRGGRGGKRINARQNFVRCNLKGGSSKKFLSKAGSRGRSKRGGGKFGRFKTKFLPQAGDGADYLEGYKDPYHVCFKCGRAGHWAQQCPGLLPNGQALNDENDSDAENNNPTAAIQPAHVACPALSSNLHLSQGLDPFEVPPLEELTDERLAECLKPAFGYGGFRGQQLEVVRRVLEGKSTLAVLPTGSGKSLCYQLPALLLGGTCLVVSPLIALMRDQLTRLPPHLPAAMLWGGQSKQEAMQVLADLKAGRLRVLYVAPERLHSGVLLEALTPLMPLPLVCVDEAHCVAEWGHNFRSAYFRLGHMLEQRVQCRCVLALTATATKATEADVTKVLNISPENVVRDSTVRGNLRLSVTHLNGGSAGGATKRAVLKLLQQQPLKGVTSIIVYCTFQAQADEVARYLYTQGVSALAYHAGKSFKDREHIQESFCAGKVKVVVATVAFGMGVDAQGVRGVVHLTLPRSLEEYVQQIGRAGRDGSESYCHLFLDDADFLRLRSLAHSDGIDTTNAVSFLEAVFESNQFRRAAAGGVGAAEGGGDGGGVTPVYGTLAVAQVAEKCDMKEEVMETLLSYLEADDDPVIQILPSTGVTVSVSFYETAPHKLAGSHAIVKALLQVCPRERRGCHTAATVDLMNAAGLSATQVMKELQALAIRSELRFEVSKLTALVFLIKRTPEDLHSLAESISQRHGIVSKQQAHRLDVAYSSFAAAAAAATGGGAASAVGGLQNGTQNAACHDGSRETSSKDEMEVKPDEQWLRNQISAYFESEHELTLDGLPALPVKASASTLKMDIRALLVWAERNKPGCTLTGRAIGRILHGVASPAFPTAQWSKCGFWQQYTNIDFAQVLVLGEHEANIRRQNKEAARDVFD